MPPTGMAPPGSRFGFGVPTPHRRPSPTPSGCSPTLGGRCPRDTQVTEKRGQLRWPYCQPRGLPWEIRAGAGGRARRSEAAALASPARGHSSCWAAQRKRQCRAGQTGIQTVPPPAGALGQGEDGTDGGMMRWPRLAARRPSELGPQVPAVHRARRGALALLSPLPALQGRPCPTWCRPGAGSAMATTAAPSGQGWALPLAGRLEATPEAACLSFRRPPSWPWGRWTRGREAPPGARKGGFLCSVPV